MNTKQEKILLKIQSIFPPNVFIFHLSLFMITNFPYYEIFIPCITGRVHYRNYISEIVIVV